MKYTRIPADTFKEIQLNAGILLDSFNPETGAEGNLLGATTGGLAFEAVPEYVDFGEEIDNCPKNSMELKKLDKWEIKLSGTFATTNPENVKRLIGAADIDVANNTHIIPRNEVNQSDFKDVWLVADYSDVNVGLTAGFIAIHLMNTLSSGGFKLQTTDKEKGASEFELTAHYSMENQDVVPFEVYVVQGYESFSVAYDSNGGSGTMIDTNSPYSEGSTVTVLANTFTAPDGKTFSKFNTAVDGSGTDYDPADEFTINENTTLFAQWDDATARKKATLKK